ncbi:MAG TPA: murein biosynthesis integral membrane protein MurJ [Longimicrobiales bacterium]|nr:murein biosynthesis integral membrane protein MurJ [Longimicrobiales bacterium]
MTSGARPPAGDADGDRDDLTVYPPDEPGASSDAASLQDQAIAASRSGAGAQLVALGILLSRFSGLLRDAVFSRYFGLTLQADAFRAALRMPNVLQNLLGEGTLSASFIPVYSELHHQGRREEAGRVAGAVFALLLAVGGLLSLIGVLAAPLLVSIFLRGFDEERRALTITATRIIFPMTGVLVLSAWSLGVLNSHRRFLLPYLAPVFWNAAMIATLVFFGGRMDLSDLTVALAWGALVGGMLQFGVQLPAVLRLEPALRIRWNLQLEGVRTALRNAAPAVMGRGVVQLSGWLDLFLASWLIQGAVAALTAAQTLYLLPISLFGMSIAAAELPELSRQRQGARQALRERMNRGLRQTALFTVPTVIGYLLIGNAIVGAIYQGGRFRPSDTVFVHLLLATYALGLFASTSTRLYSSAFYALHETRVTARVATIRVLVSGTFGAGAMLALRNVIFSGHSLGAVGLALGASAGAWLEWGLLRGRLNRRLEGNVGVPLPYLARIGTAALIGTGAAAALFYLLPMLHPVLRGGLALALYGALYFPVAALLGVPEARGVLQRIRRRLPF